MTSRPTPIDVSGVTDLAGEAARKAGETAMEGYGRSRDAERKGDQHDIVTIHDRRAEALIRTKVRAVFPESCIIGEESGQEGSGRLTWFVDPIDGTKNFSAGIPFFCVSIGVALDDELVGAAIYDPVRDELFTASPDGAWLNGARVTTADDTHPANALVLIDAPNEGPDMSTAHEQILRGCITEFGTVRRLGSCALELAYVACGRADAQVGLAVHPWDVAAGILLVTAAGGAFHAPRTSRRVSDRPWTSPRFVAHSAGFALERSPTLTELLR